MLRQIFIAVIAVLRIFHPSLEYGAQLKIFLLNFFISLLMDFTTASIFFYGLFEDSIFMGFLDVDWTLC